MYILFLRASISYSVDLSSNAISISNVIYCHSSWKREEEGDTKIRFSDIESSSSSRVGRNFFTESVSVCFAVKMEKKRKPAKGGKGQTSFLRGSLSPSGIHFARVIATAATRRSTFYRDIVYARAHPEASLEVITLSKYAAHSWRLRLIFLWAKNDRIER